MDRGAWLALGTRATRSLGTGATRCHAWLCQPDPCPPHPAPDTPGTTPAHPRKVQGCVCLLAGRALKEQKAEGCRESCWENTEITPLAPCIYKLLS